MEILKFVVTREPQMAANQQGQDAEHPVLDIWQSDIFMADYWQQRPLLLPGFIPQSSLPELPPNDLAGLACDDGCESRLVRPQGVQQGPCDPEELANMCGPFSILVQGVDRLVADVNGLKAFFGFIPRWRFADVMVSLSTPGGGVGAHYDLYDVFLVQGQGRRRWRCGRQPLSLAARQAAGDRHGHKLLPAIPDAFEVVTNPGDVLYIPPGVAHEGTTLAPVGGDADADGANFAMTFSVGMRAPERRQLLLAAAAEIAETCGPEDLWQDGRRRVAADPFLLAEEDLAALRLAALSALEAAPAQWESALGCLVTEPFDGRAYEAEPAAVPVGMNRLFAQFLAGKSWVWQPGVSRVYTASGGLYVEGTALAELVCGPCQNCEFLASLCQEGPLNRELLAPEVLLAADGQQAPAWFGLWHHLVVQGWLVGV